MKILITSVGTATSVNLIKYFKKLNQHIVGVDINDFGYTAGSTMCESYYKVPYANDPDYLNILKDIINSENIDLLIPVNDIEIYILSKCRDEITCKCIIPDTETIEILRDKYICSNEVLKHGIDVPEILEDENISVKRIIRDKIGVGSKGIIFVSEGMPAPLFNKDKAFLQKCVSGEEYTVDVLADMEGNPVYIIPRKRLEVKSGVATKVLLEENKDLISIVKKVTDIFKIPGFSNYQFIKEGDKYWFIEINYRFSGAGAATLATSNDYLSEFLNIVNGNLYTGRINHDTKFNTVVTRYYEEVVYEISGS